MKATASYSTTRLAVLCLAALPGLGLAQGPQGNGSPYSAFGFGDLSGTTQVSLATMGIAGLAAADHFSVSRANPASYPELYAPVFEAGMVARDLDYETSSVSAKGQNQRLLGLSLGVPFGRARWGVALGLQPASTVEYELSETAVVEGGDATFRYSGSGGLNLAYLGLGYVVWQHSDTLDRGGRLSLGANLDYLFGTVESSRKAYYPSNNGYYNSAITSSLVVRSPTGTVGIQYADDIIGMAKARARMVERKKRLQAKDRHLENEWLNAGKDPAARKPVRMPKGEGEPLRFRIGLTAELPAALNAKNTSLAHNFTIGSTGVEFPRDTAYFIDGAEGQLHLPLGIGAGLAVYDRHWTVTAEYRRRDWSTAEVDVEGYDQRSTLVPGASYALGASFLPSGDGGGSFWQRTVYRAGLHYVDDYISVKGTPLTQMGAAAGFSFPLMGSRTRSRLNLGTELGQRGTTDNGLLLERYINIYFGISITPEFNERWMKKSRID